jgi:hypothetical protein
VSAEARAQLHLAHPLGVKGFAYRRVKNDVRDASDLADLLRMGRLPQAWIAPPEAVQRCLAARSVVFGPGWPSGVGRTGNHHEPHIEFRPERG